MDTACRLLIAETVDGREVARKIIDVPHASPVHRASFISELGIDILICGAISHQFAQMLTALGINTKPWFRGTIDEVIAAYLKGVLQNDNFLMPGCGRRRNRERARRCGQRADFHTRKPFKEE